jgi:hypothetical protein
MDTIMDTLILKETAITSRILQVVVASFREEQINTIPFAGSWTAGQVGEHLLISATGVLETINGPVEPTERDPSENAGPIKKMFLDFTSKMSSPDFVLPSDAPKNKETLLQSLETTMNGIHAVAEKEDLSATCVRFEFPGFGRLTRLEWITFLLAHIQRHVHQLNIIAERLNGRIR